MADYGSPRFQRASECARRLRFELASLRPRELLRTLVWLPGLVWLLLSLPTLVVPLSSEDAGRMIRAQLGLRRLGVPRFRLAQGVLVLPASLDDYLRGRHRQAVRTNLRRAREQGLTCRYASMPASKPDRAVGALTLASSSDTCEPVGDWTPETDGVPSEYWWVSDREGTVVGWAWLTVDSSCALLHTLRCSRSGARWLLHSAIVERLCASGCTVLLTNSFDAPLMEPGDQYFQRLLGYSIARIRPRSEVASHAGVPVRGNLRAASSVLSAACAVGTIVASQVCSDPPDLPGMRALIWLTPLVLARLVADRPGWALLPGGMGGLVVAASGIASGFVGAAYLLCGFIVDLSLTLFPRLARRAATMGCLGALAMAGTAVAPDFPAVGHRLSPSMPSIVRVAGAIVFGACAASLGCVLAGRAVRSHFPRSRVD